MNDREFWVEVRRIMIMLLALIERRYGLRPDHRTRELDQSETARNALE